jgi:hypothetical protein
LDSLAIVGNIREGKPEKKTLTIQDRKFSGGRRLLK